MAPKFEIVCRLVVNRNAFQEALKGPFPVLRNWCRLHRIRGVARGWWGVVVVVIHGSGQVSVIGLGLRIAVLKMRG
jgi:hypothetical protein